ncbi:hypothetical protein F5X99DRAFT_423141 [Biscogniauxia marginata]|nr:hypothetical protein F5X99DRAFT_423141 [Biscogniauxia marginata]
MKCSTTIVAAFAAAFCRLAVATPLSSEHSGPELIPHNGMEFVEEMQRKGFSFEPMKWTGQIDDSGKNHAFYGSMQDIQSQAQKVNPEFEFRSKNSSEIHAAMEAMTLAPHSIREGYVNCHTHNWEARISELERMNAWQWAMNGECSLGPRKCAQVQCAGTGAARYWISWCNLRDYTFYTSCTAMAWGTQWILQECRPTGWLANQFLRGEHFASGNRQDNDFRTYVGGSRSCELWTEPGWPKKEDKEELGDGHEE